MTSSKQFLGIVLIIVGALALLGNAGLLNLDWSFVWRLWPLILIFWGLRALLGPGRGSWLGPVMIMVALLLLVAASHPATRSSFEHIIGPKEPSKQTLQKDFDPGITTANLTVDAGAGSYKLGSTSDKLISVEAESNVGSYVLDQNTSNTSADLHLKFETKSLSFGFGHNANNATINLNAHPVWNLVFHMGASNLDFDFSPFNVEKATLDTGASSVSLQLGDKAAVSHVTLHSGASSIDIRVLRTVGCEITADTGLASKDFIGFTQDSDKTYRTAGFDSAAKKIYLDLNAGASSLSVMQY